MPSQEPLYVDGAVVTYSAATGTIAPALTLTQDGTVQNASVPETSIETPSTSGLYLITAYIVTSQAASGGASPSATLGPVTVYYTSADTGFHMPNLTVGLLLQDGSIAPTNSANIVNGVLAGSTVINALAGHSISLSIGYASSGTGSGGKVDVTASGGAITGFLTWIPIGSGYTVGDILTVVGGNNDAVLTVTSVNGSGQPTGATITTPGTGYSNFTTYNLVESSVMVPMQFAYHFKAVFLGGLPS